MFLKKVEDQAKQGKERLKEVITSKFNKYVAQTKACKDARDGRPV